MLDRLENMAKVGMFNEAFIIAENRGLYTKLYDRLRNSMNISLNELKKHIYTNYKTNTELLNVCYNLKELDIHYSTIKNIDLSNCVFLEKLTYCYSLEVIKILQVVFNKKSNNITRFDLYNNINIKEIKCIQVPKLKIIILNEKVRNKVKINCDKHIKIIYK